MTNITVPYVALSKQTAPIKEELMQAFSSVLDSGQYILGPEVSSFEESFANYCETKFATGLASGTCALHLVLKALGIEPGDEVITAPNSFIASASTIALVGAKPVFVDIGPDLNLDPNLLESAITPKTKAIIPVHLTGRPAKMVEILEIAKKHNLKVLEDCAQAVGATLNGQRVGSWGDAGCFSLHPLKNLRAFGDGGMMTTNDPAIYHHLIKSRNHGFLNRDTCEFWSYNCRLDALQAALLQIQLKYLDTWTTARREIAFRYNKELQPYVEVPLEGHNEYCVYQTYVIQADRRNELKEYLNQIGIQALIHYPVPIHLQPAAQDLGYTASDFPMTLKAADRILSLPLYPEMTLEQQDYMIESIAKFYQS